MVSDEIGHQRGAGASMLSLAARYPILHLGVGESRREWNTTMTEQLFRFAEVIRSIDERARAGDLPGVRQITGAWLSALEMMNGTTARPSPPLAGKPGRPFQVTDEQIVEAVREHLQSGHSYQSIAKKLEIDPSTLSRRIRKLPMPVQRELEQLQRTRRHR